MIQTFTFNPFETNCYVLRSEEDMVIIDPGFHTLEERDRLFQALDREGGSVTHILLTHGHIDHIFGVQVLSEALELPIHCHAQDLPLIHHASEQARLFGIEMDEIRAGTVVLDENSTICYGSVTLNVLHTPGHSPGSVSFVDRKARRILSGDVLFKGSIGRTDLWQASLPVLMQSIYQQLIPLGRTYQVLPGHGPATTIADEVDSNPFLTGLD